MDGVYAAGVYQEKPSAPKKSLSSLPWEALQQEVKQLGQPAYRAGQLFGWLHQKQAASFEEMSNLPAGFRQSLAEQWMIDMPEVELWRESQDGTRKYLLRFSDGHCVETVLMRYNHGNSLCISTQVGCRMGCRFCASTQGGLVRNLSAGEMLGEVYAVQKHAQVRVSNVVLMGIGEPLDNYEQVLAFIRLVCDERGQNLAGRNLSLSTCGLVSRIDQLAELKLPLTLSISLHATTDETRRKLMPVANQYTIQQLLSACRAYQEKTGRRISYEYAVVPGVNDRPEDAKRLAKLLSGMNAHVNLIAVNPVEGSPYGGDGRGEAKAFCEKLLALSQNATVRRSLGTDIGAACGQLRAEHAGKQQE